MVNRTEYVFRGIATVEVYVLIVTLLLNLYGYIEGELIVSAFIVYSLFAIPIAFFVFLITTDSTGKGGEWGRDRKDFFIDEELLEWMTTKFVHYLGLTVIVFIIILEEIRFRSEINSGGKRR